MASTSKPTVVFVHGAWHGPEGFDEVRAQLEAVDYPTAAVRLPSVGSPEPLHNADPDIEVVRSVVEGILEAGKDVIVVPHSYGGIPSSMALAGMKAKESESSRGRVLKLAYIASLPLEEGVSIQTLSLADDEESEEKDSSNQLAEIDNLEVAKKEAEAFTLENGMITVLDGASRFYADLTPEKAAYWESKLKPHSAATFAVPVTYAAWRDFPSSYLICLKDLALKPSVQERLCKKAGITEITRLDTHHSPFLSHPNLVVEFIKKSAGEK